MRPRNKIAFPVATTIDHLRPGHGHETIAFDESEPNPNAIFALVFSVFLFFASQYYAT